MAGLVPFDRKRALRPKGFEDFYNLMDDFFNDSWLSSTTGSYGTFKVDVQDKENEYLVVAELPGIEKEEVDIRMDEGQLTIGVQRDENMEEENKQYVHRERRFCSMKRSLYLEDANHEGIQARLENGLLNIKVPKKEKKDRSMKIDIE
jgi:HSP20 family protein